MQDNYFRENHALILDKRSLVKISDNLFSGEFHPLGNLWLRGLNSFLTDRKIIPVPFDSLRYSDVKLGLSNVINNQAMTIYPPFEIKRDGDGVRYKLTFSGEGVNQRYFDKCINLPAMPFLLLGMGKKVLLHDGEKSVVTVDNVLYLKLIHDHELVKPLDPDINSRFNPWRYG